MSRVALSIGLLVTSGYLWPSLYKRSSTLQAFLIIVLIGFLLAVFLFWLSSRIEPSSSTRLNRSQLGWLVLCSLPVGVLEITLASAYWIYIGGPPLHLGPLSALPLVLLVVWTIVDAGIRGLSEEWVFRGILQPALMKRYADYAGSAIIAVLITTFWFLVAHLYGIADYRLLPYLAFLSLCYGYLVARTGRFLSSAILHVTQNALAILVAHVGLQSVEEHAGKLWVGAGAAGLFWLGVLAVANFLAIDLLAKQWMKAGSISKS